MREKDDRDIKSEIDEISKKIDQIILNIEQADPTKKDTESTTNGISGGGRCLAIGTAASGGS